MDTEKRLLLALALSFIVVITWTRFFGRPTSPLNPQNYPQQPIQHQQLAPLPKQPAEPTPSLSSLKDFEFQNHRVKLIFSEPIGAIRQAVFSAYQDYEFALHNSLLVGFADMDFIKQVFDNKGVTYIYTDREKQISKEVSVADVAYTFDLTIRIKNTSPSPISVQLPVTLGRMDMASAKDQMSFHDVTVSDQARTFYPNPKKNATFADLNFIGMRDRYFCAIIQPMEKGSAGFINKVFDKVYDVGLFTPEKRLEPGQVWEQKFRVYIGPQDTVILKKANPDWQAVVYFGRFDLVAQVLLAILEFLNRLVHNWGWAIILLSLAIYIGLYPLMLKQMRSMKEMQALQPQMEEIKRLYKDNNQRIQKETWELWKKHKVNPFGGCLPIILQFPIFIALYQVLSRTIALKGADFFWIKDLAAPDRLSVLPQALPFIGGTEFNILPVLTAIAMFLQLKTSMVSINPSQAEQQKITMFVMPLVFGVAFYRMPSGLVLYWLLNNILTVTNQLLISRKR